MSTCRFGRWRAIRSFRAPSSCELGSDLAGGVESIETLVVSQGAPRLTSLGYPIAAPFPYAEHRLYELLNEREPDAAYSRYNALIRRKSR